jgi:acyl-coenzyme A thioesterase PaaI-like protein
VSTPQALSITGDDEDPAYDAHVRLTDSLRRVIEANASLDLPLSDADEIIAQVEALADRLEGLAGAGRYTGPNARQVMLDDPGRAMAINPISGRCNPIAPPVDLSLRDGEVKGTARLGQAYVGPVGRVHGGWVCGLLDQVLGFACVAAGQPGFTASITVHLRKATPLGTDLQLVGRVTDRSGRRISAWGAIYADGVLTAEADGLFVAVPADYSTE